MITVQDLRSGTTFELEGHPFIVIKYEHIKMGRGSATIKVRVRNLVTGTTLDKTFINSAKVAEIITLKRKLQYLYNDGANAVFMDPKNFEQVEIPVIVIKTELPFIKEGDNVDIMFWEDRPISVDIQPKVELTVTETAPGVKGNSATNVFKSARLENGMDVKVPLFINMGEKVRVDTRTGEYIERVTGK